MGDEEEEALGRGEGMMMKWRWLFWWRNKGGRRERRGRRRRGRRRRGGGAAIARPASLRPSPLPLLASSIEREIYLMKTMRASLTLICCVHSLRRVTTDECDHYN